MTPATPCSRRATAATTSTAGNDPGAVLKAAVPQFASGQWHLLDVSVISVRKARHKRLVTWRVVWQVEDGSTRTCDMMAKPYGSDRGAFGHAALAHLWANGLAVPEPFGYSAEFGTMAQQLVSGQLWADRLRSGGATLDKGSALAAEWLLRLHEAPRLDPDLPGYREFPGVATLADELGRAYPEAAGRIERLAVLVADRLDRVPADRTVSHGDFHPKNVILASDEAIGIDFDRFGWRERDHDIGYALAQLCIMSFLRLGRLSPGATAGRVFWQRYQEGAAVSEERVAAQTVRTLIQSLHFELVTLKNDRIELLERWPQLAELILAEGLPALSRLA